MFEAINMVSYLPIRQERIDKIKEATMRDEVLTTLAEVILCGWPEERNKIPPAAMAYFHSRDELAVQNGLIFKGQRIIIPLSMRPEIKKTIHSSHLGVESCLRRAQECVYWPGMNAELRQYISTCEPCNRYQISNQKETLMNHEIPDRPWERVAVDLMEIKGQDYLVTVDYFSNYWEVDHLQSTKTKSVIRILKGHFARHGIPSIHISDNGPQFNNSEFCAFAEKWDFEHRTSSPGNPRANGMAESAVKTAKKLRKKAVDSGSDPYLAILDYRNTPSQGTETSPAQRLFGRRTRNLLPMTAKLLEPQTVDVGLESRRKRLRNLRSQWYYDKGVKDLEPLQEGDKVRIKPMAVGRSVWEKGVINRRLDERSYEVVKEGGTLRRNRIHLKRTNEQEPHSGASPEELPQQEQFERCQAAKGTAQLPTTTSSTSVIPSPTQTGVPVPTPPRHSGRKTKLPAKYNDFMLQNRVGK